MDGIPSGSTGMTRARARAGARGPAQNRHSPFLSRERERKKRETKGPKEEEEEDDDDDDDRKLLLCSFV
jgi:hypothetical protein